GRLGMRPIPLARTARRRLHLEPPVVDASGTLDARDTAAARRVAARMKAAHPKRAAAAPPGAGDVVALAALNAVLHQLVEQERRTGAADLRSAVRAAEERLGPTTARSV